MDLSSAWLDPLRPMLARVGSLDPLPDASRLQAALGACVAPFVFETQTKKRTRGAPFTLDDLYEARIARLSRIPTRAHLHDLMNALVWATFPESKRTLAHRQYRALVAQVGEHPTRLPNARTRERDVLAMIDEGGLLVLEGRTPIVFGHAVHEHLVTTAASVRAYPIALSVPHDASLDAIDVALATRIEAIDASEGTDAVVLARHAPATIASSTTSAADHAAPSACFTTK